MIEMETEKIRKFSLNMDIELYKEVEREAERQGVTMTEIVLKALHKYFHSKTINVEDAEDMELAVRRLVRDSHDWFGDFDFGKFLKLAKERGMEGAKVWSKKMIQIIKPYLEKETEGIFSPSMEDIIDAFSKELCVDVEFLKNILLEKESTKTKEEAK
jgi:predicted HicB family RNase H-like nuclease